jgi:hypothetical protein
MQHGQSVDEMITWANTNQREGIIKLRPILIEQNGQSSWVVWGDEGYPFDEPQ